MLGFIVTLIAYDDPNETILCSVGSKSLITSDFQIFVLIPYAKSCGTSWKKVGH